MVARSTAWPGPLKPAIRWDVVFTSGPAKGRLDAVRAQEADDAAAKAVAAVDPSGEFAHGLEVSGNNNRHTFSARPAKHVIERRGIAVIDVELARKQMAEEADSEEFDDEQI